MKVVEIDYCSYALMSDSDDELKELVRLLAKLRRCSTWAVGDVMKVSDLKTLKVGVYEADYVPDGNPEKYQREIKRLNDDIAYYKRRVEELQKEKAEA